LYGNLSVSRKPRQQHSRSRGFLLERESCSARNEWIVRCKLHLISHRNNTVTCKDKPKGLLCTSNNYNSKSHYDNADAQSESRPAFSFNYRFHSGSLPALSRSASAAACVAPGCGTAISRQHTGLFWAAGWYWAAVTSRLSSRACTASSGLVLNQRFLKLKLA
jgi:hypothetical protein